MENNNIDDIVRDNVPKLHSYVRRHVSNRDDAEDIVQDTLYQFLRTIRVLENPISHVSSWLYTVAHNLIVNHGKKHSTIAEAELTATDSVETFMHDISEIMIADDGDCPEFSMLRAMVWDELDKALAELPQEQRDAVIMTEIEGMNVHDAALQMGVPQNTFLSRKHYAILHIRKRLHNLYQELIST